MRLISRREGLPAQALDIVEDELAVWQVLHDQERARLLEVTDHLLSSRRWEAARGFDLDDTVRVLTAAQAALLVLNLDVEHYRLVSGIVVHASTLQMTGTRPGLVPGTVTDDPLPVLGLAQGGRGPVVLAWDQVLAGARRTVRGHNVVLHEFAHKLDMLDGTVDGTPLLPADVRADWVRVCTDVYQDLVEGVSRPPMRWYGATNPGEFFAVAYGGLLRAAPRAAGVRARSVRRARALLPTGSRGAAAVRPLPPPAATAADQPRATTELTPWHPPRTRHVRGGDLLAAERLRNRQGPGAGRRPDDDERPADHAVQRDGAAAGVVPVRAAVRGLAAMVAHDPEPALRDEDTRRARGARLHLGSRPRRTAGCRPRTRTARRARPGVPGRQAGRDPPVGRAAGDAVPGQPDDPLT
jgi:Mlc titration factor MtfA (ptsG expression regulator)